MTTTPADGTEPNRPQDGTLAPNVPGTPTDGAAPRLTLTRPQKLLIGFVIFGAVAIAAIGFIGSYTAVTQLAYAKGFGAFSRVFTLGIDLGIGVFLALDLLLTWLRMPYPALRYGAWLLTAATIAFNAVVSWPDPVGVGMHAVIPILFVVSVEAARHAIGRMADITADRFMEGPPASRWFLNPIATFILWRRQRLWAIRKWDTVLELERERRIYCGKLRKEHGRGWRRKARAEQILVLRLAKDGMSIQKAIDLPKEEERKQAEAEANREAEARAKSEAEAEAKHQAELRRAEAEAKRRAEIAEAEAAEARARAEAEAAEAEVKYRSEAAAEAARLEVEAKRRTEAEAARILEAETEAKLAAIAREQQRAEAEAELNRQRQAAEQARLQAEAAHLAREQAAAEAELRRQEQARQRAQRIASEVAATSATSTSGGRTTARTTSGSETASASVPRSIAPQRGKRQSEIEALLVRMVEAGDPKCVSLEDVMRDFDLKQTTAYDRLSTAQQLYADAQPDAQTA
ncbi:DUF2637 domain-containing protein [Streptomyces sp. LBUM 1486]|uniref:DUF2637 domain-containing protein n=1 Tax=Streptomyces scabiei TaxID=1930 RepID=UPI001B32B29D|nr:DUF2637 domain-containing protein [Streptomyces sp. LBUM 1486]MBP5918762.1 DUF2637 domain-containing protein [Streptomyces sp. LBUM 1486]